MHLPVGAWLVDGEVVSEGGPRGDIALRDTLWAVHVRGAVLEEAMEMQARALVLEIVV